MKHRYNKRRRVIRERFEIFRIVHYFPHDQFKIHTLFIDLNYQRKGIGKKLLLRILKEAGNKGIKKLFTWSTYYAYHFYKKFGFTGSKEIKLPEGKEDIILIEMEKKLE